MKRIFLTILSLCLIGTGGLFAQSPELLNYQGVARDASGNPLTNQAIGLQFSIRSGSATGTVEYQETHAVTTSNLGLFNLQIGAGTVVSGTFTAIDWANNSHFVEVEIDPSGGSSYTALGTQQLVAVPYALHATTVEIDQVDDADADPANELQTISQSGNTVTLSNGGGSVTVDDADADPANEYNTGAALNGSSLDITDGGGTLSVDLSSLAEDTTNELQTLTQSGSTVTLSDGGGSVSVDDADADPANEYNTGAALNGSSLDITDGGGTLSVDLSPLAEDTTNELQTLSISGSNISLSNGGGSVAVPDDGDWTVTASDVYRSGGSVGIGTTTPNNRLHVVETSSAPTAAASASGAFGPTWGQLAVQGDTDHEGVTTLDISGQEIGVLGISAGGSSTDNYGIYGHSNGWGGRFSHTTSGNIVDLAGTSAALRIVDGNQASGRVLTSDAAGNASWAAPAAGGDNDWTVSGSNMYSGVTGSIGIKTTSPLNEIHLNQSNATTAGVGGMRFQWSTNFWKIFHSGLHFSFVDDGVRVAYINDGTGNYVQPSDGSLKKNITPIGSSLSRLMQLRPVSYHYNQQKDTDQKAVGFIAQEVEQVMPEIVYESEDGLKGLSYTDFAVHSVRAIQEQQEQIEALKKEIEALKQLVRESNK